jgi:prepilin-type N-terminal cleavage/methylation domain-containing protein
MRREAGFTLVELVIVIITIGVISAYAMVMNGSSGAYAVASQAESLASDLRHAQSLAHTWGRSLRVTINAGVNGTYSVSCVTAGNYPCNSSPVIDPSTGTAFARGLENSAVLAGPATIDFDSFGMPSAAASFSVTYESAVKTISLLAITGLVSVSP